MHKSSSHPHRDALLLVLLCIPVIVDGVRVLVCQSVELDRRPIFRPGMAGGSAAAVLSVLPGSSWVPHLPSHPSDSLPTIQLLFNGNNGVLNWVQDDEDEDENGKGTTKLPLQSRNAANVLRGDRVQVDDAANKASDGVDHSRYGVDSRSEWHVVGRRGDQWRIYAVDSTADAVHSNGYHLDDHNGYHGHTGNDVHAHHHDVDDNRDDTHHQHSTSHNVHHHHDNYVNDADNVRYDGTQADQVNDHHHGDHYHNDNYAIIDVNHYADHHHTDDDHQNNNDDPDYHHHHTDDDDHAHNDNHHADHDHQNNNDASDYHYHVHHNTDHDNNTTHDNDPDYHHNQNNHHHDYAHHHHHHDHAHHHPPHHRLHPTTATAPASGAAHHDPSAAAHRHANHHDHPHPRQDTRPRHPGDRQPLCLYHPQPRGNTSNATANHTPYQSTLAGLIGFWSVLLPLDQDESSKGCSECCRIRKTYWRSAQGIPGKTLGTC
ncbi:histidine-rich protein PFHRP-II-like [Paramacrobiotus metropolitanus]|uniref:histidine-rich protein PFHRP-II-like n=1 Tax=Paramacrobiotus metropolitanus TaxID=2943436 RepID=UPI0024457767|nr:histidine-rich protein PFHRP-II-like [Paramacrobiotus metropolitanus]